MSMTHIDDYPNDPDDGHDHEWEPAEGIDTGTDFEASICIHCGMLSAEDPFEGDEA